jgi:hypothetical protein
MSKKKQNMLDPDAKLRRAWCCIDQLQFQIREYAEAKSDKKKRKAKAALSEIHAELSDGIFRL